MLLLVVYLNSIVLLARLMWVLVAVVGVREGEEVTKVLLGDVSGIQQVVVVNLQGQAASVEGACRVWGTFSVCTTGTIHSAITKVCWVKKKTKEMSNGKVC